MSSQTGLMQHASRVTTNWIGLSNYTNFQCVIIGVLYRCAAVTANAILVMILGKEHSRKATNGYALHLVLPLTL